MCLPSRPLTSTELAGTVSHQPPTFGELMRSELPLTRMRLILNDDSGVGNGFTGLYRMDVSERDAAKRPSWTTANLAMS